MAKSKERANPFYILLVLTGIVFCITACAYGVMTVRGLYPDEVNISHAGQQLMSWLDSNGFWLLMTELVVLGIFTFCAIALDEVRTRKNTLAKQVTGDES